MTTENENEVVEAAEPQETAAEKTAVKEKKAKKEKKPEKRSLKIFKSLMLTAFLPVLASGLIRFIGINMFVSPNKFAPGGVTGASVLLEVVTHLNWGIYLLIFNVPLFFLAFFFLGKREAILSTVSMLLTSGISILVQYIPALQTFVGKIAYGGEDLAHRMLGAAASGIFLGIALAIMIKCCGTSGGTTILASLVTKKFRNLSVSMLTSVLDAVVVFASVLVYNDGSFTTVLDPVILALISLFVTSRMSDVILQGFKTAYKFEIITDQPEELAAEIMRETRHGVTKMEAEGMYTREGKSMLVCIIRKRQIAQLQRIIKKYPGTFAYFTSISEVYGRFAK